MSIELKIIIISIIIFVIFFILTCNFFGYFIGRSIIFRQPKYNRLLYELKFRVFTREWFDKLNYKIENIKSKTDNLPLKLYIFMPKNKITKKLIIFSHGMASNHSAGLKIAKFYLENGFTFLTYDVRGWGDNYLSSKTTLGFLEKDDLFSIIKYIKNKYNFKKIFLHGESLGGKITLEYAVKYDHLKYIDGYIEDSGFASFKNMVLYHSKNIAPFLPWILYLPITNWYIKRKTGQSIFQNKMVSKLYKINSPVLGIHSHNDAISPYSESNILKMNIKNFSCLTTIDSPHCLTSIFHRKIFIKKIIKFVNKN